MGWIVAIFFGWIAVAAIYEEVTKWYKNHKEEQFRQSLNTAANEMLAERGLSIQDINQFEDTFLALKERVSHTFADTELQSNESAVACPSCGEGYINLEGGMYGQFLGCSRYPECDFINVKLKDLSDEIKEYYAAELQRAYRGLM